MKLALAFVLLAFATTPTAAHSWYPIECCSGQDCHPIACDQLEEIDDGRIRDIGTGTIYRRDQIRPSQDGQCHVCTAGGFKRGAPICVFVQQGS